MTDVDWNRTVTTDETLSWRTALLRHRDFIENARLSTSRDRDKMVLTVAGGTLTVSVALLETFAKNIGPMQVGLLGVGWLSEILAVGLVLMSLSSSERALEKERERVDCMLQTDDGVDPAWPNAASRRTERFNAWASVLTIVGIVLILAQATIGVGLLNP